MLMDGSGADLESIYAFLVIELLYRLNLGEARLKDIGALRLAGAACATKAKNPTEASDEADQPRQGSLLTSICEYSSHWPLSARFHVFTDPSSPVDTSKSPDA
jgi:hypothetical protein